LFRPSYDDSAVAVVDSMLGSGVFMVLTILIGWLALAALAAFFIYCCSFVSNGKRRELTDDDFAAEPPGPRGRGAPLGAAWAMPTAYERRAHERRVGPDQWQRGR